MPVIPALALIPHAAAAAALGIGRTKLYADVSAGLITKPVSNGKNNLWPSHEIQAITAYQIDSRSKTEIKTLVRQLMEQRSAIADSF
jgi:predicted DNA-binding transcriptional regulator AlpA